MKIQNILPKSNSLQFAATIIAMLLWLIVSWLVTANILATRIESIVNSETVATDQEVVNIAQGISTILNDLQGIPTLVANDSGVMNTLSRFGANAQPSQKSPEERKNIWSKEAKLKAIDAYLSLISTLMHVDDLFILNAAGDCVASSNLNLKDTFIGTNYAGREYFKEAMSGSSGYQYAVGKKSNKPGMFFSAPVFFKGQVIGVSVSKIGLSSLSHLINQSNAFITDEYGVIVLSSDKALEMNAMPDATFASLSSAARKERYKREDFPFLPIHLWPGKLNTSLQRFSNEKQPLLMSEGSLLENGTKIHVYRRLPEVVQYTTAQLVQFLFSALFGAAVILLLWGLVNLARIRKNTAIALQNSAQRYQLLFDSSRDALMLVSPPTWKFTSANQASLQLFGVETLEEFVALGPWNVSPKLQLDGRASRDKAQEYISIAMNEGACIFEWVHQHRDGKPFFADVMLTRMGVGKELFLQATVRDISDRKRAEEELLREKNEQKLLISKLEEAQNHLLQSEKMASIGQLAAGVAHEINNPIGYVYSNLGTLEKYVMDILSLLKLYEQVEITITDSEILSSLADAKGKFDIAFLKEDLRELMAESKDGIVRVKNIVQNLKDFSHVDSNEVMQFYNLHKGLDSTLNIVNNEIKYKADLIKNYGVIPEVECLLPQINQVFMNLLVNAAHAIEERGTITISTGQQESEVWIKVSDTGKGIAPENIKKIFDPFFTTKPVGKGTGLGLSLSYSIINKHHGRIEVQSEVGKGTVFVVWLPIKQTSIEQ